MSTRASTAGTAAYHSQMDTNGSLRLVIQVLDPANMSQQGSQARGGSQIGGGPQPGGGSQIGGGSQPGGGSQIGQGSSSGGSQHGGGQRQLVRPIFAPQDPSNPTAVELEEYGRNMHQHCANIMYLLDFLNDDPAGRPPFPNCRPSIWQQNNPIHGWIFAQGLNKEVAILNNHLESVKIARLQQDNAQTRQMSMMASVQSGRLDKIKVLMPSKYDGKKGDPALTFLAACNNYCIMSPGAFADDSVCVRWALQQLEDKAGQWAIN